LIIQRGQDALVGAPPLLEINLMSKKKIVLAVAAVLAGAGAIAAVSAPGPRGHARFGNQEDGHGGMERRGWMNRTLTKDQHDTRIRERFAALDRNSDGFIDASELEAMIGQRADGMRQRMRERFGAGQGGGSDASQAGGQAGLPMLGRFDKDRDGKVTREEFQAAIRKRFADADLDNDGRISDADLPPMMRGRNVIAQMAAGDGGRGGMVGGGMGARMGRGGGSAHGGAGGEGGLGRLLQGAEVKDGAVSLDAVLAAANKHFDRMDRTKDGVLDKADADVMRKDMTDYRVKRFIHAHGADKDGKVSREQFFARATERFAEMDLNGDGRLGRGEFGGRHGGHRGGHFGNHDGSDGARGPRGEGRGPAGSPSGGPVAPGGNAPPKQ
jgi:Ca2+-binding EF-hand superfamily protein